MPSRARQPPGPTPLWVAALALTAIAVVWQWQSGPRQSQQGEVEIAGQRVPYQLPTSGAAGEPLRVTVGAAAEVTGTVRWRHSTANEAFQGLTMLRDGSVLVGLLPAQPAGEQLEYQLVLAGPFGLARIPAEAPVLIRSRGEVSSILALLYLGVLCLAMAVGVRAGLAALFEREETRRLTWIAAGAVTAGVVILGPLVRRAAFGAFWSGWPLGSDAADSRALVLWLVWTVAALTLISPQGARDRFARTVVVLATVILIGVALLPGSVHLALGEPGSDPGLSATASGYSTEGSDGSPSSS